MNIFIFIKEMRGGGAEGVVATLSNQLAERGHRITLVSHLKDQAYEISQKVNIVDVRAWQYDTYVGSLPVRIYKKAANRFLDIKNFRKLFKQEQPEVVISFLGGWLWQLILLCRRHIPLVSAERNAMVYPHGRRNFFTKQILYRMVYMVQVMSRYDKGWVRNRYKRVVPMPNPLRFPPISAEDYKEGFEKRKNILACGRLVPQKGFDKLIHAFAKVADEYPDWDVDICGEDPAFSNYSVAIKQKIADCGLENRIHFLGFRKDVDAIMRSHAIFSLSSQHEGFPNVLSEAMANGLACVSFDIVTGPSEIIVDGLDGIIVEDQNVNALADGLATLMEDNELRYKLGLNAIEDIKRFSKEMVVDKWEKLFKNIIKDYYGKD